MGVWAAQTWTKGSMMPKGFANSSWSTHSIALGGGHELLLIMFDPRFSSKTLSYQWQIFYDSYWTHLDQI